MPRVLPSDVRIYIETAFGNVLSDPQLSKGTLQLSLANISLAIGLLSLIEKIPEHLITLDNKDYSDWLTALGALKFGVKVAEGQQDLTQRNLHVLAQAGGNVIAILHREISKCPDALPPPEIAGLEFIDDDGQREDLRLDIARVRESFIRNDWKSATVLAGAVIEALFLWGILKRGDVKWQEAANHSRISKWINDRKTPEHWFLDDYLKVATRLDLVSSETLDQCRLAQGFRNLIHPGKSQRRELKCDRATALSAEAGMEHTIRDLVVRFPV